MTPSEMQDWRFRNNFSVIVAAAMMNVYPENLRIFEAGHMSLVQCRNLARRHHKFRTRK